MEYLKIPNQYSNEKKVRYILEIILTFDVEDFISNNSTWALQIILEYLEEFGLKAIFFITGHMAERLQNFPEITNFLKDHEIGYHSSSHSVHPTIFEFTDISDYKEAYSISQRRETAHINPLNGKVEGKGGIHSLRKLCPTKKIIAYRSPGYCWSPPHIEAIRDLGIRFDSSTNLANASRTTSVHYKGITFYPCPTVAHWTGRVSDYRDFMLPLLRNKISVLGLHPSLFVNRNEWDSIYHSGNPKHITKPLMRNHHEIKSLFSRFNLLLSQLAWLQKTKVVNITTDLKKSDKEMTMNEEAVERCYETSVMWAQQYFNYKPRFFRQHFFEFFDSALI